MPPTSWAASTASGDSSSGEGEHALGEIGAALRRADRAVDEAADREVVWHALEQQIKIAQYGHQHIVEVVRHAAGELAEALQLLHLVNLGQRHLALAGALLDASLQLGVAALQLGIGARQLGGALLDPLLEPSVEPLELPRLAIELGEDAHLRAQQLRHDRHGHIVDPARLVTLEAVEIGERDGGDEDDRRRLEARMVADHRRQLEAVELGHAHVDEDDGDVVLEQMREGLSRRLGRDEVLAQLLENRLVAEQLRALVVDQEDINGVLVAHAPSSC